MAQLGLFQSESYTNLMTQFHGALSLNIDIYAWEIPWTKKPTVHRRTQKGPPLDAVLK
jgi:hypothetical protein